MFGYGVLSFSPNAPSKDSANGSGKKFSAMTSQHMQDFAYQNHSFPCKIAGQGGGLKL